MLYFPAFCPEMSPIVLLQPSSQVQPGSTDRFRTQKCPTIQSAGAAASPLQALKARLELSCSPIACALALNHNTIAVTFGFLAAGLNLVLWPFSSRDNKKSSNFGKKCKALDISFTFLQANPSKIHEATSKQQRLC